MKSSVIKLSLSLILLFSKGFFKNIIFAQELIPFENEKLYGYKDQNDKVIIKPQYQYADKFISNYARITQNDKIGIIDKQNNLIIPPKYEYLKQITENQFVFGFRTKYYGEYKTGIIDDRNQIIIPAEYYSISFYNNFYFVNKQSYQTTNDNSIYEVRAVTNKYGIFDKSGKIILEPKYSYINSLNNGYYSINIDLNGNHALFDDKFKRLTDFKYMFIDDFYDDLAKVRVNNLFGYIDLNGNEIIKCLYEMNYNFIDGLALAKKNNNWGIINTKNETILDFKYNTLGIPFKNQVNANYNDKWGVVNLKNEILLDFMFDQKISDSKGITAFKKDSKWQTWDYEKKKIFPEKYDSIILINRNEYNILTFYKTRSPETIKLLAMVKKDDKWGFINEKGEITLPIKYDLEELYNRIPD